MWSLDSENFKIENLTREILKCKFWEERYNFSYSLWKLFIEEEVNSKEHFNVIWYNMHYEIGSSQGTSLELALIWSVKFKFFLGIYVLLIL